MVNISNNEYLEFPAAGYLDPGVRVHGVVPQGEDGRTLLPDDDEVLKNVHL